MYLGLESAKCMLIYAIYGYSTKVGRPDLNLPCSPSEHVHVRWSAECCKGPLHLLVQLLPVPLPKRLRFCQLRDQHPLRHFPLHLLPRLPGPNFGGASQSQWECSFLTLGPVHQRIVDKGLKQGEQFLSRSTQDGQDVFG